MKTVIKREFKNYMKNPLLWVGLLIVIVGLFKILSPYLHIHYLQSEKELGAELSSEDLLDADIMEGYVLSSEECRTEMAYEEIKNQFVEYMDITEAEAQQIIEELRRKDMEIPEMAEYLEKNYGFHNVGYIFEEFEYHKGSLAEINSYIKEKVDEKTFSFYFARKFADYGGMFMGFFAAILLVFLFIRDAKKDTYELLHTKPVSACGYICGKVMGGFLTVSFVVGILALIFGVLCEIYGRNAGFPVRIWDIFAAAAIYILPNMLMVVCVYVMAALIFKNPLPAAPLLFLYMIYSNMGSSGPDGTWGYYGRPLAIMVRFPGKFFETAPPPMAFFNQIFLILASALLILASIYIWRRRTY